MKDFKEEAIFTRTLNPNGKSAYVLGEKPPVDCILCALRDDDDNVASWKLYQGELVFVTLNLYPYNPGHAMIVPCRHVERWQDLEREEIDVITATLTGIQRLLQSEFGCDSFNGGFNEGPRSGASISHFHFHVVPRFNNELGFIDVVGKTRATIFTISEVYERLAGKLVDFIP